MERKYSEDFHLPFMANNPTLQQNQNHQQLSSQNHHHPLQINGSHSNFYQFNNHDLFQNPSQRYLIPPQIQTLPQSLQQTQGFLDDSFNLEDCFSRMNLNVYSNNNNNNHNPQLQQIRLNQSSIDRHLLGSLASQSNFPKAPIIGNGGFVNVLQRKSDHDDQLVAYASSSPRRANMYNYPLVCSSHQQQQRSKYSSLKELKGQVSSVAKDQQGCRFLQKKFEHETIKREEIEMMLSEVKDQLHELMVHQYANYLIQKLFEAGNQEQRTELLRLLVSRQQKFLDVCTDIHGTRAVQKFMERIFTREQRSILLSVLKPITLTLTNNDHGHHIIELCFNKFSNEDTKHIVNEIVKHCVDIATDKSGCFVLQQCMVHAKSEAKERLFAKIIANTVVLSEHCYGNYVVQFVIERMNLPHVTSNIIVQLGGCYGSLSMNKYGSNVVERLLNYADENDRARIIVEIMHDRDFLKVLQDPFGNYVVQTALQESKGELHKALVAFIQYHFPFLHSHPFGNKVLARTKWRKNVYNSVRIN